MEYFQHEGEKKWPPPTAEQRAYLKEHVGKTPMIEISRHLHKTTALVSRWAADLGLKTKRPPNTYEHQMNRRNRALRRVDASQTQNQSNGS